MTVLGSIIAHVVGCWWAPWSGGRSKAVLVGALLCLSGRVAQAQDAPSREYSIKAVFLHHFTHFVDWPSTTEAAESGPFLVGVLGDDPFEGALEEVTRGEKVRDRPIEVRRYAISDDFTQCDLLFVTRSEASRMTDIIARVRDRPILTLGDTEEFVHRGGMVGFVTRDNRVRLQINLEAARAAGFSINSNLLRAATIVGSAATGE